MKLIALICILFATPLTLPSAETDVVDVTMVQLISNPERFDGKVVRVIGFLRLEFEGDVLYLHREDYENAILGDGIWVDATPEITKQTKTLNMHYVLLIGTFSSRDRGHMDMWSGTITKISRADLWQSHRRSD